MKKETILVIDDSYINRKVLNKILQESYDVIDAENGKEGLELLSNHYKKISAIVLDLVMPIMDGYEFLRKVLPETRYKNIPIIVATAEEEQNVENKCFKLGAWDFVTKPYHNTTLKLRLKNVISRSQVHYLEQIKFLAERDELTGLYNRKYFLSMTKEMLLNYPEKKFVLVRMDIDQFRLFNSIFGGDKGDILLKQIAGLIPNVFNEMPYMYGRIESDVFCICEPYDEALLRRQMQKVHNHISYLYPNYYINFSFGIYVIRNIKEEMERMFTCASAAARDCKQNRVKNYAFYNKSMSDTIYKNQKIMNEMHTALKEEQFAVYLQPKYDLRKEEFIGAEALARWIHPEKGMISPGVFIPVFEQSGFIAQLDYYMWEHVCILLRKWIEEGNNPDPISVNMSRISLYNTHIVKILEDLIEKYQIPISLLNLEVTESVYMDNPDLMKKIIKDLRDAGFIILMDDFGSGYSSLNTLKDIDIDILKIDMKFLPTGKENAKSEKILASVIRMASRLLLPTIVEGVETVQQKEFLESIGCGCVQGFFFARPMPVEKYEELMRKKHYVVKNEKISKKELESMNALWKFNNQQQLLLQGISVPVAVYEYKDNEYDIIRMNHAYINEFFQGGGRGDVHPNQCQKEIWEKEHRMLNGKLKKVVEEQKPIQYEYNKTTPSGENKWYRVYIQYVKQIMDCHIVCAVVIEITTEKNLESELERIKKLI